MRRLSCCIFVALGIIFFTLPRGVHAADIATKSANINIEAHVPHRSMDLQFLFQSNLETSAVGADQEVEYTITYGSWLEHPTPMVIEAEWSLGSTDQSLSSLEIVQYVAGSATADYWGGSVPVVDIKKRTITWTVDRFPRYTIDKTLRFKLKTPGRYVTDKNVNFTVTAKMKTNEVTLAPITLEQVYAPREFILKEVRGLQILAININKITTTSFSFYLLTSVPTKTVVTYGTTPELGEVFTDTTFADQKIITIDGLQPGTTYYFKILIENDKGIQRRTPELLTVTTASTEVNDLIDESRLLFSTQGIILPQGPPVLGTTAIVVPQGVMMNVYIPFKANTPVFSYFSVLPRYVLGATTETTIGDPVEKIRLLETQEGTFTGNVAIPRQTGTYDMLLETQDADGNIATDVIGEMTVTSPLLIMNEQGKPIEKALVYLEQYNPLTKRFEYFPARSFGFRNPTYSKTNGMVDMVLPYGEYTVNVNALGFQTKQQRFVFPIRDGNAYPQMTLTKGPFSFRQQFEYYSSVFSDMVTFINETLSAVAASYRFLDLTLVVGLFTLSVISLFVNIRRIKLTFEGLVIFVEKWFSHHLHPQHKGTELYVGFLENEQNTLAVHAAVVLLQSAQTNLTVSSDITRSLGEFHLHIDPKERYILTIKKPGYITLKEAVLGSDLLARKAPFGIHQELVFVVPKLVAFAIDMIRVLFYSMSDALLVGLLIATVLLILKIGIIQTIPISVLLLLNIVVWVEFQWKRWRQERSMNPSLRRR